MGIKYIAFGLILALSSVARAQLGGKSFEANGFIGMHRMNPSALNNYIDEFNGLGGTTTQVGNINSGSTAYGEAIFYLGESLALGARYSINGHIVDGKRSNVKTEVGAVMADISAVLKYLSPPEKFQFGVGVTAGIAYPFGVVVDDGVTKVAYGAENVPVGRFFITGRFNFGRFALFGEGGYMHVKAAELKNGSLTLSRSDGTKVDLDLSGTYLGVGMGFQF